MDVAVHCNRGQWSWAAIRPSILGDGLLERARSTSLALIGVTAAVGLGMVALAMNQSWPLVAGGPIPPAPRLAVHDHVAVGARPAARPRHRQSVAKRGGSATATPAREIAKGRNPVSGSAQVEGAALVRVDGGSGQPASPGNPGRHQAPVPAQPPASAPTPSQPQGSGAGQTPVATPTPSPPAVPPPTVPPPPEAAAASTPGQGNAFGKGNGNGPPGGVPPGQVGKQ
jgi:hypothetical protein